MNSWLGEISGAVKGKDVTLAMPKATRAEWPNDFKAGPAIQKLRLLIGVKKRRKAQKTASVVINWKRLVASVANLPL